MKAFTETKTTIWQPEWIKKEFLPYNETFRKARSGMRREVNSCRKCSRKFKDGEMMALASFGAKGNKTLCRSCADELDT